MKFTLKVHGLGAFESLPWDSHLLNCLSPKVKRLAFVWSKLGVPTPLESSSNIRKCQARQNFLSKQELLKGLQGYFIVFLWIFVWFAVFENTNYLYYSSLIRLCPLTKMYWCLEILKKNLHQRVSTWSLRFFVLLLQAGHAALPHQRSVLSCGDEHWTFLEFVMPLLQSCFERPYSFGDIKNHSFSQVICVGDDERPFPIQRVCLTGWNISVLTWEQFWIQDSMI